METRPSERDQIEAPKKPDLRCRDHLIHCELLHAMLGRLMVLETRVATLEDGRP